MKYIFYGLVLLALGAVFTKPTPERVEAMLKERTLQAVRDTEVNLADMGLDGAMVTLCKLQPNACWDVLRGLTEITHEDRYVYAKIGIDGPGDPQICYGVFRQLLCL
jgi:hypothetical protein